jgi:HAD superfamily hydrolase (TIGR01509 family)
MLKAVIFDFDGIIVDSEPMHYRAFQKVLEPLGAGYGWQEYLDRYIGFDDRDAFREAFRVHGLTLRDGQLAELISAKAACFQEVIAHGVEPYDGVVDLIRSLSGTVPLAICSGALRSDIEPVLAQLSLETAFDRMVTADDVEESKPDPASYRLALLRLQEAFPGRDITPAETLAIEDTPAGISSARGAGLQVLAVTNSYPAAALSSTVATVHTLAGLSLEDLRRLIP